MDIELALATSVDEEKLRPFQSMKGQQDQQQEVFVADGEKLVHRLLESNIEIEMIFGLEHHFNTYQNLIKEKGLTAEQLIVADKRTMSSIVGYNIHQGFMALAKTPSQTSLDQLEPPYLVLNGVLGSENIGSIIRNSCAFGFKSLIFDEQSCPPYVRRAVRVSMGTIFKIQYHHTNNLVETLKQLKEMNVKIYGAALSSNSKLIAQSKFENPLAIIVGNEDKGISEQVQNYCDLLVEIPMKNSVDSLNVATASAILMYQATI